jgi:hypothetical protein
MVVWVFLLGPSFDQFFENEVHSEKPDYASTN